MWTDQGLSFIPSSHFRTNTTKKPCEYRESLHRPSKVIFDGVSSIITWCYLVRLCVMIRVVIILTLQDKFKPFSFQERRFTQLSTCLFSCLNMLLL